MLQAEGTEVQHWLKNICAFRNKRTTWVIGECLRQQALRTFWWTTSIFHPYCPSTLFFSRTTGEGMSGQRAPAVRQSHWAFKCPFSTAVAPFPSLPNRHWCCWWARHSTKHPGAYCSALSLSLPLQLVIPAFHLCIAGKEDPSPVSLPIPPEASWPWEKHWTAFSVFPTWHHLPFTILPFPGHWSDFQSAKGYSEGFLFYLVFY